MDSQHYTVLNSFRKTCFYNVNFAFIELKQFFIKNYYIWYKAKEGSIGLANANPICHFLGLKTCT